MKSRRHAFTARIAVSSVLTACAFLAGSSVLAQPQSAAQAKCLTLLAKRTAKLVKVQGKQIDACVHDLARGSGNPFSCLTADAKGRVAKAAQKLADTASKACGEVPDFDYVGPAALIPAATSHRIALVELSTTIAEQDASEAACGRLYLKGASKLLGKKLRGFEKCLKSGLADASIASNADVVSCFSAFDSSADAKLSKLLSGLDAKLAKKGCASSIPLCFDDPSACAEQGTTCRACQTLRIGGALTVDCDLLDNGVADGWCPTACGDGELGTFFGTPEQCDDGNRTSGDGCDSDCTPSACGNGIPAGGELCDSSYGSLVGGICVGGAYDGAACSWNTDCEGGYCTSCPYRASCAADCAGCDTPFCTIDGMSQCSMFTGTCIGQICALLPTIACDDPACGTAGNCTIDGYCVPTDPDTCAEYEGVSGSCTLGF